MVQWGFYFFLKDEASDFNVDFVVVLNGIYIFRNYIEGY